MPVSDLEIIRPSAAFLFPDNPTDVDANHLSRILKPGANGPKYTSLVRKAK